MKSFNSMLRGTAYVEHKKIEEIKEGEDLILKYGDNPDYPNAVSVWFDNSKIGEIKQIIAQVMTEKKNKGSKYNCKLIKKTKYPIWKCSCNKIYYNEINKCGECGSETNHYEINGAMVCIIENGSE